MPTIREPTASYLGPITDTSRWANFQHRSNDIFICTPPKSGTTWTQAICAMLAFGKVDHGSQLGVTSPWIDAQFVPLDECLSHVEAQRHRRFIKTHTPFDGIPHYSNCTYLVVFRDPRDAYCSGLSHRDNMNDQALALGVFPSGPTGYDDWLNAVRETGSWDLQCLDSLTHFFKSYWQYRDEPNVHLYHYTDMKRDLERAIASMAAATNIEVDDDLLSDMTEAASFDSMKRNAEQFAPESGTGMWKAESGFFASGKNQQWKETLSHADAAAFDRRLAELLPPDEAHWLVNGNG